MKLLLCLLCVMVFAGLAFAQARVVKAAEVNGTYRYRDNEIKILALGRNKLRIQMDLIYKYKSYDGPTANTGEALGEASIEDDTATFRPPDTQNCTITIKFLPRNKIHVTEDHMIDCGFGFNVSSAGTYIKIRAGKPKFDAAK